MALNVTERGVHALTHDLYSVAESNIIRYTFAPTDWVRVPLTRGLKGYKNVAERVHVRRCRTARLRFINSPSPRTYDSSQIIANRL